MPLDLPEYQEVIKRIRADVKALLPDLDPTIFGSAIRAITDSNGGRHYDNVLSLAQLEKELFPETASLENLKLWASYEDLTPLPATPSTGNVIFTGTVGSTIALGTSFRSANSLLYTSTAAGTITNTVVNITTLTRIGSTVTATTSSNHGLASNIDVTIAGAVETEYNGAFTITVLSLTTFSYTITGTPSTPATGTITVDCDCVSIAVLSDEFGEDQNLESGAELTPVLQISGVDNKGYVDFNQLAGGADEESKASLYIRVLQSRANPVANFNSAVIEREALKVAGVTRVKVKRVTPYIGAVTVLFVRDGDDNIIPSAGEVADVKAQIITILQASSEESDVVVTAPTPVTTAFSFSSITPNTTTMEAAILANLQAFYTDEVDFETTIVEEKYKNAIIDTIDPETGESLTAFTLASPSGNIAVTTDEIGILGTVSF